MISQKNSRCSILTGNGNEHGVLFRAWPLVAGLGLTFHFSNHRDLHFPLSIYNGHFSKFHRFSTNFRFKVVKSKDSSSPVCLACRTWCPFPYRTTCHRAWHQIWPVLRHWAQEESTLYPRTSGKKKSIIVGKKSLNDKSLELNVAISQKNSRCTIFDRKRNWTWCPFPCLTTCRRAWLQIWLVLRHWVQEELTLCPRSNGKQKFMKHVLA